MMRPAPEGSPQHADEQRARKRVRMACNRCRRQKLKCDTLRPCALCVRSSVECVTSGRDLNWNNDQASSSAGGGPSTTITAGTGKPSPEDHRPTTTSPLESLGQSSALHEPGHLDQGVTRSYHQDTSSVKLTREILSQLSPNSSLNTDTSALPGGSRNTPPVSSPTVPINQLVGVNLPPKAVSDALVEAYFESVHWFMALLHEPSFRQRYDAIILTGHASPEDLPFLFFLMLLLAIGAQYIDPASHLSREVVEMDLGVLQRSLLHSIRAHLLDIIELGGVECVQICVLLSTFYLYHDRPNLAFAIHGMGVKCAHSMCLHQERAWKDLTPLGREVKRRVWWAMYVADCFFSIIFGRPRSIRDEESQVSMVTNLEDTAARHPTFSSTERVGETNYPVTIFSYQRYKFTLYTIAAHIIREIYSGSPPKSLALVTKTIQSLTRELNSWFRSLPAELKHPNNNDSGPAMQKSRDPRDNKIIRTFRLQALTLQLAYDNIQILLHRPLLQLPIRWPDQPRTANPDNAALAMSKAQCWESAVRTSNLDVSVVRQARYTHAASYIGIQMFTAGTVLSIVALSAPLSSEAQLAKQSIARIVSTSASIGKKTLLSSQSQQVLKELVRLILQKEMNSIFVEPAAQHDTGNLGEEPFSRLGHLQQTSTASPPTLDKDDVGNLATQAMMAPYGPGHDKYMAPRSELSADIQQDEVFQGIWNTLGLVGGSDNGQTASSVRQAFTQVMHQQQSTSDWTGYPADFSLLTEAQDASSDLLARPLFFTGGGNGLRGPGQAWLWQDEQFQPPNSD